MSSWSAALETERCGLGIFGAADGWVPSVRVANGPAKWVAILLPNAALRGARVVRRLECTGVLIRSLWSGPREKPPTNQAQAC